MLFEDVCSFCENEIDHVTDMDREDNIYCLRCSEENEYHWSGEHDDIISDECPKCNE